MLCLYFAFNSVCTLSEILKWNGYIALLDHYHYRPLSLHIIIIIIIITIIIIIIISIIVTAIYLYVLYFYDMYILWQKIYICDLVNDFIPRNFNNDRSESLRVHSISLQFAPKYGYRDAILLASLNKSQNLHCHSVYSTYRKTSSISRTKSKNLNVSCIPLQLSSLKSLKPGVELRMKM